MSIQEENLAKKFESVSSESLLNTPEEPFENVLRPKNFDSYIGQEQVKKNLKIAVQAAKKREESLDHVLLYGPPGLGKTTLAQVLCTEMQANLRITSGPAIEKPGDLAAILTNLKPQDFLFIDEIHRLRLPVEEILYTAMEDFAIDLMVGKGPSARTMRLKIPPFTLVGATTKLSSLSNPLRDRFGHIERLEYYEESEIAEILENSARILQIQYEQAALMELASRTRRTPRIANRLLKRIRDFAEVHGNGKITQKILEEALRSMKIDARGLDKSDQLYLEILAKNFQGGPVGLSTIAAATAEDAGTIEDVVEPFLIREGFLERTPKGRKLTLKGMNYSGVSITKGLF